MPDFGTRKVKIIGATVLRETAAAILVEIGDNQHWIPKTQIDDDSEVYKADTEGVLVVSEWIAGAKGLI